MSENVAELGVEIEADFSGFEERLRARLKRIASRIVANIPTRADVKRATAQLSVWRRVMTKKALTFTVNVSKKSLASALTYVKAFTGISALSKEFQGFGNIISSFFTNLPGLARTITMFSTLGAVGVHAIGALIVSIASMGPAVSGLGAVLAALPGLFLGFAAGIVAMIVAFKNAPASVKAAAREFRGLSQIISTNFWKPAEAATAAFLQQLAPQVKAGMAVVSAAVGSVIGALATSLRGALDNATMTTIFENIAAGARALVPAMAPFANIAKMLLVWGTSLLPGISRWLVDIATRFEAWLTTALATGRLNENLAALGEWLKAAGSALNGLWRILTGIGDAAAAAGIGGLFAPLQQIADIVNSPAFQSTLTLFFKGAAEGSRGLLAALGPIGSMLQALMPILSGFIADAGVTLGNLFSGIANEMAKPVFQKGLGAFFEGILGFLKPLIPVLPQFVSKLAMIGELAGSILGILGPILATALEALVPVLDTVLAALMPVVNALGPVLQSIIVALVPILMPVAQLFGVLASVVAKIVPVLGALITAILTGLAPVFNKLIAAIEPLLPVFGDLIIAILEAFMPLLDPLIALISALVDIVIALLPPFLELAPIMAPILPLLKNLSPLFDILVAAILAGIVPLQILAEVFGAVIKTIIAVVKGDFSTIPGIWKGVWDNIQNIVKNSWNNVVGFIESGVNKAIDLINGMIKSVNNAGGALGFIKIPLIGKVSIPRLAKGATVLPRSGGTAAILGEGGRAESVVDTGLMNRMLKLVLQSFPAQVSALRASALAGSAAGAAGAGVVNKTFQNNFPVPAGADPAAIAQEFVDRLAEKVDL